MKNLFLALVATVLIGGSSFGQHGDDGCILLPGPLKPLIPTTIGWGDIGLNKSSGSSQLNQEAVLNFLVDVNNGIVDSKNITSKQRAEALSNMATIIKEAEKDQRYQFVMSLVNNNQNITLPGFISLLEKNKPALLAMPDGHNYYVKVHYSLQMASNYIAKPQLISRIDPTGKGGPNGDIVYFNSDDLANSDCAIAIIGTAGAGAALGGPIGAAIGAIIGSQSSACQKK